MLQASKRRYCIFRRTDVSRVVLRLLKGPGTLPIQADIAVEAVKVGQSKKGKSLLEVESPDMSKPLALASEVDEEVVRWVTDIKRAMRTSRG